MYRSIRVRITGIAAIVVTIVLVVTAFALLASQRKVLTSNLDEALRTHASAIAESASTAGVPTVMRPWVDDDAIAQIATDDGTVLGATANFTDALALPPPPDDTIDHVRTERLIPDEPAYRIASVRHDRLVVHVAAPLDDIDESIAALRRGLMVAIPAVTAALTVLIWWLVGRTLRPVEAIRREVADITGSSLNRRVTAPESHDEVERLARTMNAMLDRIEDSAERQRRFIGDASHELRSPLTRIRSELEVDLSHPTGADLAATHRSVLDETEHLQRLVDDLLVLARDDPGAPGRAPTAVDLDDIVLREAARIADGSVVPIDVSGVSAAQVAGDPHALTRVVRNLTENAVRHARSQVTIRLGEHGAVATLTVTDDGPGIPAEFHEQVFERFTRTDAARSADVGGTGLGLAITRAIVHRHGGTVRIDANHSPGANFVVDLPVAGR